MAPSSRRVETTSKHRRQPPPSSTKDEDLILKPADRRKLVAQSRDIHRNFTIAGWMIRKHLDYTSTFAFQARTGLPEVDEQMEALIRWWSRPANCDVANRHTLQRLTRLWEERRTIDGDVFVLKLSDGRVQSIEGDRIRTPDGGLPQGLKKSDFTHGVQVAKGGAPKAYVVCKRDKAGKIVFERILRAGFVVHHGYFDRFDQVRGISPTAPAGGARASTWTSSRPASIGSAPGPWCWPTTASTGAAPSPPTSTSSATTPTSAPASTSSSTRRAWRSR